MEVNAKFSHVSIKSNLYYTLACVRCMSGARRKNVALKRCRRVFMWLHWEHHTLRLGLPYILPWISENLYKNAMQSTRMPHLEASVSPATRTSGVHLGLPTCAFTINSHQTVNFDWVWDLVESFAEVNLSTGYHFLIRTSRLFQGPLKQIFMERESKIEKYVGDFHQFSNSL